MGQFLNIQPDQNHTLYNIGTAEKHSTTANTGKASRLYPRKRHNGANYERETNQ